MFNYTLQLDRLTLSLSLNSNDTFNYQYIQDNYKFRGNTYTLSPELELRKVTGKRLETNYLHSFELWANGNRVATLHTDSRLPQTEKTVKLEFTNYIFYTAPGFLHYLNLLSDIDLWVETISYFEIACDAQLDKALLPRLSRIERHSTLDKHNPKPLWRPATKLCKISKLDNGAQYVFGHSAAGSTGNGKQIAVYSKSIQLAELAQAGKGKEYISKYHAANGLDNSKQTERIEARIGNRWIAANNIRLDIHDLANPQILKSLFVKAVADVFKFAHLKEGSYDTKRNWKAKQVNLLPLDTLQAQPLTLPTRPTASVGVSDAKKRTTLKTLVHQFVSTGHSETAAAIRHFRNTNTPPKNSTWTDLTTRYALSYEGAPTAETKDRIAQILSLLKPI